MTVWVLRIVLGAAAVYLVCLVALALGQRRLMYFPATVQGDAAASGLPGAQTLRLTTADGEKIVAWYKPAAEGKLLLLFFHGNGNMLSGRVSMFRALVADGTGLLAIDYRGYGGSTGSPSEAGLIADGEATYARARTLGYPPERIVIIGESVGTGVAVAVAAAHPTKALVLDSAFSATVDVAAAQYWMFPVRWLMKDTFLSRERIGGVAAPKLFLHGKEDRVIPIAFGHALFDRASEPKAFVAIPGRGHVVLPDPANVARMKAWLATLP